jgi:hypothetical protein
MVLKMIIKTKKSVTLSIATAMLSGCVIQGQSTVTPTIASIGISRNIDYAGVEDVQVLIRQREAEYNRFIKQAQQRGMYGGALRGALIGLLLEADPVVVGGITFVGGFMGAQSGEAAASKLVKEHKDYITRRWSLERLRASVKADTKDTYQDLILTEKMRAAVKSKPASRIAEEDLTSLTRFKLHALSRAVTLREVMPIYDNNPEVTKLLEKALREQLQMTSEIEASLGYLEGHL